MLEARVNDIPANNKLEKVVRLNLNQCRKLKYRDKTLNAQNAFPGIKSSINEETGMK